MWIARWLHISWLDFSIPYQVTDRDQTITVAGLQVTPGTHLTMFDRGRGTLSRFARPPHAFCTRIAEVSVVAKYEDAAPSALALCNPIDVVRLGSVAKIRCPIEALDLRKRCLPPVRDLTHPSIDLQGSDRGLTRPVVLTRRAQLGELVPARVE